MSEGEPGWKRGPSSGRPAGAEPRDGIGNRDPPSGTRGGVGQGVAAAALRLVGPEPLQGRRPAGSARGRSGHGLLSLHLS